MIDYHIINQAYENHLENEWERMCEDPRTEPDPGEIADAMREEINYK